MPQRRVSGTAGLNSRAPIAAPERAIFDRYGADLIQACGSSLRRLGRRRRNALLGEAPG
jgi:hypothetical protein